MQGGKTANGDRISGWVWVALAMLLLLALAVVFVLPRLVQEYELPLVPRASTAPVATTSAPATSAAPQISPFDEAQRARQRREAQDALASLLERQQALDEMAVSQWAWNWPCRRRWVAAEGGEEEVPEEAVGEKVQEGGLCTIGARPASWGLRWGSR